MSFAHGRSPFEEPAIVAERHVTETLERHPVVIPISHRAMDHSLKKQQRLLALEAQQAHRIREPEVAAALEVAESAVEDARNYLAGRKS